MFTGRKYQALMDLLSAEDYIMKNSNSELNLSIFKRKNRYNFNREGD